MATEGSAIREQGPGVAAAARGRFWAWPLLICTVAGCGRLPAPERPTDPRPGRQQQAPVARAAPKKTARPPRRAKDAESEDNNRPHQRADPSPARSSSPGKSRQQPPRDHPTSRPVAALADLLGAPDGPSRRIPGPARVQIDEPRVAAAGIRRLAGKRLTLLTDLAPGEGVDVLPKVFEQAFPQWCGYFGIDPADHPDWHVTGFLMEERARFKQAGLLPDALPPFEHGFSWSCELWLDEQPSDYYRRHLLLHEGTHSFMNTLLGGCGAPWYMEGIAELLSTHRWHRGRLTLNYIPRARDEVPMWGRIKKIQELFAANQAIPLVWLIHYDPAIHPANEAYAWCWAAAAWLDRHPRYQDRFRQLRQFVTEEKSDFSDRFRQLIGDQWDQLCEQWQVYVAELEYGHDIGRTSLELTPGRPLPEAGATVEVAVDRGWQNSGLRLEGGAAYLVRASGRYQVADQPQIWWCEPGGVSIRYYKGRPLGILLGAVRPDPPPADQPSPLLSPVPIGLGATLSPNRPGTLFLRVNDSAGELGDNAGSLAVHVRRASGLIDNQRPER